MKTARVQPMSVKPRLRDALAILLLAIVSYNTYAQLPDPGMQIVPGRTAILITDPQNDFLSPEGDGYQAALVNFRFIANTVWTTQQAVQNINAIQ